MAVVVAAFAVVVPATPAAAQNLFEFLFGGIRRPPPPPINFGRPGDAFRSLFDDTRRHAQETVRSPAGPGVAYCVRLCDGRYFPVQAQRNFSADQQCKSFCPASATKIFAGSAIAHATAADGQRYADLTNAFVYRQRIVPGCSCDGKDQVGVAHVPVADDPTLRPGDIVATDSGFTVYNGGNRRRQAAFTPVESAKVPRSLRNRLLGVKIAPRPVAADVKPEPAQRDQTSAVSSQPRRLSARAP